MQVMILSRWRTLCTFLWMLRLKDTLGTPCGTPGRAPNTMFEPRDKSNYLVGDTVTYHCENNLTISATNKRYCRPDGRWLGDIPICYRIAPFNTSSLSSSLPNMQAVIDNNDSSCLATSGSFNNYLKATLQTPSVIAGIRLVFSSHEQVYVDVLITTEDGETVNCGSLTGNVGDAYTRDILCGTNSKAKSIKIRGIKNDSHYFSLCEVKALLRSEACLRPDMPFNGFGNVRHSNGRVEYNYSCNPGYELKGSPVVTCTRNGTWAPEVPTCVVKCSEIHKVIGTIANGKLLVNATTVNSVAILSCKNGFMPLSDDRIFCLSTGQWSEASLHCAPIRCEANPQVPHGTAVLLDNSTYYGAKLQVICNKGYYSKEPVLRMCERSGTWGQLSNACIDVSCDAKEIERDNKGQWLPFNESRSVSWGALRVLSCYHGYHIQGHPVVIQCLPNGSWSYSTATCNKTPVAENWVSEWSPNVLMLAAVAVGAGTAISILCLVTTFLILRKRRQANSNATTFHVDLDDGSKSNAVKGNSAMSEDHYYTTLSYEELKLFTVAQSRKPSLALPRLPDADPVYAQPFETTPRKLSKSNQEDMYAAHIYAEPVDSRTADSHYSLGSESLSKPSENKPQFISGRSATLATRKEPLWRDHQQSKSLGFTRCDKNINGMETMLQCNSIYMQSGPENLTNQNCTESMQIIDNELYEERHFQKYEH